MARTKQATPLRRADSDGIMKNPLSPASTPDLKTAVQANGRIDHSQAKATPPYSSPSLLSLIVCVGGIYASFLTWGVLQEKLTSTPYDIEPSSFNKPRTATEFWRFPVVLNAVQSLFAFVSGSMYLYLTTGTYDPISSRASLGPLVLISLTTTMASPFGYAALAHVDYLTFVLAKSCKLLPVMALHITLFGRRYAFSKYLIVTAVTAGVAIFTLYNPPKPGKVHEARPSSMYGLCLLGVNLLFDGLTNTIQDQIFSSPLKYGKMTGQKMMVVTNLFGFLMMAAYLVLLPYIPEEYLPTIARGATVQLADATGFLQRHPSVLRDVLGFAACGAVGQLFIFATLERFESLVLVTVTVTRKMLTMVLSVVWYGKSLTTPQWGGVGLVFAGIGTEAFLSHVDKQKKKKTKSS